MANFDKAKRDRLLRKYCPEMFEEEEVAPRSGQEDRLMVDDGTFIDALIYDLDESGVVSELQYVANNSLYVNTMEHPGTREAISELIREPPQTDTVIVDQGAVRAGSGRPDHAVGVTLLMGFKKYRGLTPDQAVAALVRELRDADCEQTLSLEEFFDGNDQDWSIAPNLYPERHPGVREFQRALEEIRALPTVHDVRVSVHEWPYPDEDDWISAESVFMWADPSVDIEDIRRRMATLHADGVDRYQLPRPVTGAPAGASDMVLLWSTWD